MAHLKDLLPALRAKAQDAIANKLMLPPSRLEVEEAGEYLQAYREFWKRIDEAGEMPHHDILIEWWSETFGSIRPVTYFGLSLIQSSVLVPAQHLGAQSAFFVVFASGIEEILWEDELNEFLSGLSDGSGLAP